MLEMTDKERQIYKSAGGGAKGEKAVFERREYLRGYFEGERRLYIEERTAANLKKSK